MRVRLAAAALCGLLSVAAAQSPAMTKQDHLLSRLGGLSAQEIAMLMSMLDDNGDGELTSHEMIDVFDGVDNDVLAIDDCNGNSMPHSWLGDGFCDDGEEHGGEEHAMMNVIADFNCDTFHCDDSDCGAAGSCRSVHGARAFVLTVDDDWAEGELDTMAKCVIN